MKRNADTVIGKSTCCICALMLFVLSAQWAAGREIAGVDVPPSVTVDNNVLVLNGAGIRKKFFVKVYVGALYLTVRKTSVNGILEDENAKRIVMNILYKELSHKDLVEGWNEGFANNHKPAELVNLQDRINSFNSFFSTVRRGDEIRLDYVPGTGTLVWINETLKGTVQGEDFYRALLKIWLGPKPADVALKEDMLGVSY